MADTSKANRSRVLTTKSGDLSYYNQAGALVKKNNGWIHRTTELMYSDGHSPLPVRVKNGDTGGPFYHRVTRVRNHPQWVDVTIPSGSRKGARGVGWQSPVTWGQLINEISEQLIDSPEPSNSSLRALGTTAISRCKPVNPASNVLTSLGELVREGVPSMIGLQTMKARSKRYKELGSEYLNHQFGWVPFISDIRASANAVVNSEKILQQYRKDAGKTVRRRYGFPSESDVKRYVIDSSKYPEPLTTEIVVRSGVLRVQREITTKTWFSGAFQYAGFDNETQMDKLAGHVRQANHLLGVAPTPEVIWNLTPWSWLSDWAFNTGDIMSNVSGVLTDGLVMKYGYIMKETRVLSTFFLNIERCYENDLDYFGSLEVETVIQKRLPASPFGFGLTWDGFSTKQLAILAALGITRT